LTKHVIGLVLLGTLAAGQAACIHTCETPPPFHLTLQASKQLNLDSQGRPLSTEVLILQLRDVQRLRVVDFNDAWQRPEEMLGNELAGKPEKIAVNPGETETRWIPRVKDAKYVVAVGIFRDPVDKRWWDWHALGRVPRSQCKAEYPVELYRWPKQDEEQVRFLLQGAEIERAKAPNPRAERAPVRRRGGKA
jgi:type VI secretion system protein VasD